jgi:DnaJ-class molecular chaperone
VLGIASNASAEQIRAAFKRRSRQTHPDKPTGSAAAFREVKDAYEKLIAAAPAPATRSRAAAEANTDFLRQAAAAARQAAMQREAARQAAMQSEAARAADEFARMQAAGRAAAARQAQVLAMDEARLDAEARAAAARPKPNIIARSSIRLAERRAADRAKAFADMERASRARTAASKRR